LRIAVPSTIGALLIALCAAASSQQVTVTAHARVLQSNGKPSAHAENVVVWLKPLGGEPLRAWPSHNFRLMQHNKSFDPHVLVIPVGAAVQFPNRDPFFHNVFSLFEGKRFDLGLYETGSTREVSFDRPGISYIFCNIHAEMSAVVIALDTPYVAISNRRGEISMPDVPVGRYSMRVWYETALPEVLNTITREISVTEENSNLGQVQISGVSVSSNHRNKYGMDYEPPIPNDPAYPHP